MAVYIDNFNAPFRRMLMCHMVADTTEELLDMVDIIEGMDNLRGNVYNATVQDVLEIGYNFCLAQKDPYK